MMPELRPMTTLSSRPSASREELFTHRSALPRAPSPPSPPSPQISHFSHSERLVSATHSADSASFEPLQARSSANLSEGGRSAREGGVSERELREVNWRTF
ncbi:hypothetical protein M758_6G137700 [Ceratodon purpureus]|uniref:Uncharacterized protein n=1 Tax=Ceratodon purpureus TaxID=3225 RepID=A0A8T0HFS9_CERPU|nr:hypothetical protein KC19_6G142900 [Ceratodon purpureus]KAG0613897.1 hypothetical protein M758_6G137700 [Ceratodon purpureus]